MLTVIIFLVILGFAFYKFFLTAPQGNAGLKIESSSPSSVYLNDKLVGKTTYDGKHPAGEYVVKIVPDDSTSALIEWQGKITLTSGVLTFINRELGASEFNSAGEIVSLEKINNDEIELSVYSNPDAATVLVDGIDRGVAPLNLTINEGEHDIALTSTGFTGRTSRVRAIKGYKLLVSIQLALSDTPPSPTGAEGTPAPGEEGTVNKQAQEIEKPYVEIKDTPTGFLRVRMEATTQSTEVGQLTPGVKVPFVEESEGWYKVIYAEGKEGWVSQRYSAKVE